MLVFQLTLKGWEPCDTTPETEACIIWVKAASRETLDHWLGENRLNQLVVQIDTNPHPQYDFEDGVDVELGLSGEVYLNPKEAEPPEVLWPLLVKAALQSVKHRPAKNEPWPGGLRKPCGIERQVTLAQLTDPDERQRRYRIVSAYMREETNAAWETMKAAIKELDQGPG